MRKPVFHAAMLKLGLFSSVSELFATKVSVQNSWTSSMSAVKIVPWVKRLCYRADRHANTKTSHYSHCVESPVQTTQLHSTLDCLSSSSSLSELSSFWSSTGISIALSSSQVKPMETCSLGASPGFLTCSEENRKCPGVLSFLTGIRQLLFACGISLFHTIDFLYLETAHQKNINSVTSFTGI